MYEMILNLETKSDKSLYERIYEHIRGEIRGGAIR